MARPRASDQSVQPIQTSSELEIPDIPEGFILLQDTREQKPLFSPERLSTGVLHQWRGKVPVTGFALKDGDYSIAGMEDIVTIELKRWSDFVEYAGMGRWHGNTVEKLERMRKFKYVALVVNEKYGNLLHPEVYYTFAPKRFTTRVVESFFRLVNFYRIDVYAHEDEEKCRMWILNKLINFYKLQKESQSETK